MPSKLLKLAKLKMPSGLYSVNKFTPPFAKIAIRTQIGYFWLNLALVNSKTTKSKIVRFIEIPLN